MEGGPEQHTQADTRVGEAERAAGGDHSLLPHQDDLHRVQEE
jgi:hypothetical protein